MRVTYLLIHFILFLFYHSSFSQNTLRSYPFLLFSCFWISSCTFFLQLATQTKHTLYPIPCIQRCFVLEPERLNHLNCSFSIMYEDACGMKSSTRFTLVNHLPLSLLHNFCSFLDQRISPALLVKWDIYVYSLFS